MISITTIKAFLFCLAAIGAGSFLRPKFKGARALLGRLIIWWVLSTSVLFLISAELAQILLLAVLLLVLGRGTPVERVGFFLGGLPALPVGLHYVIPFPGINQLFPVNPLFLMSVIVLLPTLFQRRPKDLRIPWSLIDTCVIVIFIGMTILDGRGLTGTNFLRLTWLETFYWLIPYFAVSRSIRSIDDFQLVLKTLLTGCLMVIATGVFVSLLQWDFYSEIPNGIGDLYYERFRGDVLRVSLAQEKNTLGILTIFACIILFYFRRCGLVTAPQFYGWSLASLILLINTGSRGNYLALALVIFVLFLFAIRNTPVRYLLALTASLGGFSFYGYLRAQGFESVDAFGTFEYRQRLLDTVIWQFQQAPFIGEAGFREKPEFEALRQGQNIIDLVNGYAIFATHYGLFGLIPLIITIFSAIFGGYMFVERSRKQSFMPEVHFDTLGAILVAALIGYCFLVATTSFVGYVLNYWFYLICFIQSYKFIYKKHSGS